MAKKTNEFEAALKNKKIPILTLDNNWHKLFTQTEPTDSILKLEEHLNSRLKRQGKLNNELKELKKIKKRLMDEIVETMNELGDSEPSSKVKKKMDDNRRLIEECNKKNDENTDELFDLSREIDEINYELMLETMEICYAQIQDNYKEISSISKWIDEIRIELKKKVVIKQQKTLRNQNFYNYMHNIFGPEVINLFDMKYNVTPPEINVPKTEPENENNNES